VGEKKEKEPKEKGKNGDLYIFFTQLKETLHDFPNPISCSKSKNFFIGASLTLVSFLKKYKCTSLPLPKKRFLPEEKEIDNGRSYSGCFSY
jgi:hypothetical protein